MPLILHFKSDLHQTYTVVKYLWHLWEIDQTKKASRAQALMGLLFRICVNVKATDEKDANLMETQMLILNGI